MKIQCNACEVAEAKVLCCADEAALCLECDEKVHAANKLAGKHQRVPLLSASSPTSSYRVPKCDICQADFFSMTTSLVESQPDIFGWATSSPGGFLGKGDLCWQVGIRVWVP